MLKQLTKELISTAKAEGGYPDSDDDSGIIVVVLVRVVTILI